MERKRISRKKLLVAFLAIAAVGCLAYQIVERSSEQWRAKMPLANALRSARAVTFVEYVQYVPSAESAERRWKEYILQRKPASADEIRMLEKFTEFSLTLESLEPGYRVMCYNPHHRVEIVCTDGSFFSMDICFECEKYEFNKQDLQPLITTWRLDLLDIFAHAGMAPRPNEEYWKIAEEKTASDFVR